MGIWHDPVVEINDTSYQRDVSLPEDVVLILKTLMDSGHEAYIVGGCVRDLMLGVEPHDWDICTSAVPEEVASCFSGYNIIATGLKHGTITIVINSVGYEVTTFRSDGEYLDGRRPSSVKFVSNIRDDLSRRDFTINAMAVSLDGYLFDLYQGADHLKQFLISCVGDPNDRFKEDALRILRAIRFASVLDFEIEEETVNAMRENAWRLRGVAPERIRVELCKMLFGQGVFRIMTSFSDIICTAIPEFFPCVGFEQNNRFHHHTVYDHIALSVSNYSGDDLVIKVALWLHDIGKPACYIENETGGHFYGHGVVGHDIAETIVKRLRFDNETSKNITELVLYHDSVIAPTYKSVKRWLNKIGPEQFERLTTMNLCDARAHVVELMGDRIENTYELKRIAKTIMDEEQCFKIRDLAINGRDILNLGVPEGKIVGDILDTLLSEVIEEKICNEKLLLLSRAQELIPEIVR